MKDRNCSCPVYHGRQEMPFLLLMNLGYQAGKQEEALCSLTEPHSTQYPDSGVNISAPSLFFRELVSLQPCYSKYSPRPSAITPPASPSNVQNEELPPQTYGIRICFFFLAVPRGL